MLTLIPRYQECDEALLESYKAGVSSDAEYITNLAAVTYGFTTNYPPSTIALAALMIAFEKHHSSTSIAIFNPRTAHEDQFTLAFGAFEHFSIIFEAYNLDKRVSSNAKRNYWK